MLPATHVDPRYWFYAIGNTPAVNLLRDRVLPDVREGDNKPTVRVLCLACGDPRNILFTLWCESGQHRNHILEFTCCDMDPALLGRPSRISQIQQVISRISKVSDFLARAARNVLLLTMIASRLNGEDGSSNEKESCKMIWNIFYHFYIPERELHALQEHAEMLMQVSESVDTWVASPYGNLIQFLSQDTLLQLRKYWSLYAETKRFTEAQMNAFQLRGRTGISTIFDNHIGNTGMTGHGARSAGVFWAQAFTTMAAALKRFWETGVAGGNPDDLFALGGDGKGWVNPMFAISSSPSGDFAVHYGSDPLLGFHLADAFNDSNGKLDPLQTEKVVKSALSQFRNWCSAFATCFKSGGLRLRFFCGEAIRLCHELQSYRNNLPSRSKLAGLYLVPSTSKLLVLDGLTASSEFGLYDVIDTSNLVDYVGMINVLPAVAPLLRRKPSSVLYTESLLQASEEITSSLRHMLCSDLSTMSLIIGLAPVGHLVRYTTDAAGNEAFGPSIVLQANEQGLKQHRMRIPWKFPEGGDIHAVELGPEFARRRSFDADQLACYFFKFYVQMFAHNDVRGLTRAMTSLLHFAKSNIITDWQTCLDRLVAKLEDDRSLLVEGNNLQDLYLYCRLLAEDAPGIQPMESRDDPCGAHINLNKDYEATTLQIRTIFSPSSTEAIALVNGARVTVMPSSPCTLLLKLEGFQPSRLAYPFPVCGAAARTKIARKPSWIEVVVPLAPALARGGYNVSPFPVVQDGLQTIAWGLPCVHLNQQPAIPVRGKFDWLGAFMGRMLSESERIQNASSQKERTPNGLLDLKESIHILFDSVVGRQGKVGPLGNFQLASKHKKNSADTLIFASAIRHDLDAGSLLIDAYVVPLTDERCTKLVSALQRFVTASPVVLKMSERESILWKHLMPCMVERCRRSWSHKKSCEYRAAGRIPLSTSFSESPLCSCGEGRALDAFPSSSVTKPFAKYATRIAISPIMPVSYQERLFSKEFEEKMTNVFLPLLPRPKPKKQENKPPPIPQSDEAAGQRCDQCGAAKADLKTCAGCGQVWYCSRECQKAAWKDHKPACGKK